MMQRNQISRQHWLTGWRVISCGVLFAALLNAGCAEEKQPIPPAADLDGGRSVTDGGEDALSSQGETVPENIQRFETDAAGLDPFFFRPDATPAVEECCTNVGKMDECWWEDAIDDGVTCTEDGDCAWAVAGACVKDPTSGSNLGVCKCRPGVIKDCYDPDYGREGVCITDPDNPSGESLCGPSYCNGYLKCSCFGGCEWWDQNDLTNTPNKVAIAQSATSPEQVHCCEGDYPWGGANIVTFYGVGSCDPEETVECMNDGECDDGNPCTSNVCNISNQCENTPASDYTGCGVDPDTTDCIIPSVCVGGFCQAVNHAVSVGTSCGSGPDGDPDDCVTGFECDGAGSCIEMHETAGTGCAINESVFDPACWTGFCGAVTNANWYPVFDGSSNDGQCHEIMRDAPDNDSCASGGATVGDLGSFTSTETGALPTITGSTLCATSTSEAGAANCVDGSGIALGIGAKDVVHSFEYTTTDDTQQQLYGFVITLEADFRAVLYTETDNCTDGAVSGHPCLWQPELDAAGAPVPWEYSANNQGNDWNDNDQKCDSSGTSGYKWCNRAGGWTYPQDVTNCKFELDGTYVCDSSATYLAQTFVYPLGDDAATTHTVYIHVDGASSLDEGNYSLKVERVAWENGQCERVNDAPRVYDITDVSSQRIYRGNLTDVANSDHSATTGTCGGYDCSESWFGVTAAHGVGAANAFWPNAAYFKIQPSADTTYCIKTDHSALATAVTAVLEVRRLDETGVHGGKDLCQGETQGVTGAGAASGEDGIVLDAIAGETYLVLLSEEGPNGAPCTSDCDYKLVVTEGAGACTTVCPATTVEAETMTLPSIGADLWSPGVAWWIETTCSTSHTFTGETELSFLARATSDGHVWPRMTLAIGGTPVVNNLTVDSPTFTTYSATFAPITGTQSIDISLLNDSVGVYEVGGDVNLYIDYLTFGGGSGCVSGAGADTDTATDTAADTDTGASCTPLTIQGEDMSHTVGAVDGSGTAWNIWSPGSAYETVDLSDFDTMELVVFATNDGSIWPDMTVTVGGSTVLNTDVTNTAIHSHTVDVSSFTGNQEVRVTLNNDSSIYGGDVNLFLDKINFDCGSGGSGTDTDSTCAYECLDHCFSWGGTQMTGTCPGTQRCCNGATIPDTDTAACAPSTIQGEDMSATTGRISYSDGTSWKLELVGSVYKNVDITGFTKISASVRGTNDGPVWPEMTLSVGGTDILTEAANHTDYATHEAALPALTGVQEIRLSMNNNSKLYGGDTNLYVDYITLACGTVEPYVDTDTGGSCTPLTIEAESMSNTIGGSADGGTSWNIWGPGSIYQNVDLTDYTTISVTARGENDGSVWPDMTVSIGGTSVLDTFVDDLLWDTYDASIAATGTQDVRVTLNNDSYYVWGGDMNLIVDAITLDCPAAVPSCIPLGCESASSTATLDWTGAYFGCLFVPYDASFHQNNWNWSPGYGEFLTVNNVALSPNEYWGTGSMPTTCDGGWYVKISFNQSGSHVEIKP